MEFQAIVVIGFRFSNITNRPHKSTVIKKKLMVTCSFYREIVLSVCLRIRRDTAKCMFSSPPVFRITNGAFSGLLRFIALCGDRQYAQWCFQVNNFDRDPRMFPYEAYFVSLPVNMAFNVMDVSVGTLEYVTLGFPLRCTVQQLMKELRSSGNANSANIPRLTAPWRTSPFLTHLQRKQP